MDASGKEDPGPFRAPADAGSEPAPGGVPSADASRMQLLYRRSTAFLIEFTLITVLLLPVVWLVAGDRLRGSLVAEIPLVGPLNYDLASPLTLITFVFLRDLAFGGTSLGKRLLGVRVLRAQHLGAPVPIAAQISRNLTFLLTPIFWLIEFRAASENVEGRRLGDRLAGTVVVETNQRLRHAHWAELFTVAVLVTGAIRYWATPRIFEALSAAFR